jgi:hypothetical protein
MEGCVIYSRIVLCCDMIRKQEKDKLERKISEGRREGDAF